ncbi:YkgJ family cysteine cluster protein [Crocinitomicaceae bacterium]|nr:YkgJ family cysteine cluster protein [Crocinitomicaceae bacterium]
MEYQNFLEDHETNKAEREKYVRKIKKKRPKNLDQVFHAQHDNAFEEIDCLKCANCCKTTSPIFRDVDIQRISKKLKMSPEKFEKAYLRKDEDKDWVLQTAPCTFLQPDNSCFIYDIRPQACREYPHTDRKRMNQVLDLTLKNAEICPAVSKILGKVMIDLP